MLMVSGHWEADRYLLSSAARPPMEYDYYGFPEHTYHIRYDAPGAPALAETVRAMLDRGGVAAGLDPQRGFDHGTFTLMHTMYPEAELPLLQLSIRKGYDPAEHLKVGELIAPLRDEGVLIVGSGLSYHDLRGMRSAAGAQASATPVALVAGAGSPRRAPPGGSSDPAAGRSRRGRGRCWRPDLSREQLHGRDHRLELPLRRTR